MVCGELIVIRCNLLSCEFGDIATDECNLFFYVYWNGSLFLADFISYTFGLFLFCIENTRGKKGFSSIFENYRLKSTILTD